MDQSSSLQEADAAVATEAIQKKRRCAITDAERCIIRRCQQEHPSTQKQLAEWFQEETGYRIEQGKISTILSNKYTYLDTIKAKDSALTSKRTSIADHSNVEAALYKWQQKIQKKKGIISGDILQQKAHKI